MDANKLRKILEIIFEYWFRTIGAFVMMAAFWLYFTEQISDKRFWVGLGAATAIGIFGPKANIDFFKGRLKRKDDEPAS